MKPLSAQSDPLESNSLKYSLLKLVNTTAWPNLLGFDGRAVISISFFVKIPLPLVMKNSLNLSHSLRVSLNVATTGRLEATASMAPLRSTGL